MVFLLMATGAVIYLALGRPWTIDGGPAATHFATVAQIGAFLVKTMFFAWLFIWVRWTLPRFRYDQLMKLGWNFMLPLALLNFFGTAVLVLLGWL